MRIPPSSRKPSRRLITNNRGPFSTAKIQTIGTCAQRRLISPALRRGRNRKRNLWKVKLKTTKQLPKVSRRHQNKKKTRSRDPSCFRSMKISSKRWEHWKASSNKTMIKSKVFCSSNGPRKADRVPSTRTIITHKKMKGPLIS